MGDFEKIACDGGGTFSDFSSRTGREFFGNNMRRWRKYFKCFAAVQAGNFTIIGAGHGKTREKEADLGTPTSQSTRERRFPLALRAVFEYDKRADRPKTNKCLHTRGVYGIMSAERTLYLRIPVSAFTVQIRTLKYTVGVWRIKPGRAVLR